MSTLSVVETYTIIHCNHEGCSVPFALTDEFIRQRRAARRTWYCPNGHSRWFPGKTDAQKAQERADQAEAAAERLRRQVQMLGRDVTAEKRRHAATKGQLTKTKKRVAHGVCPCCNRTFKQLERHMKGQHPEYVEATS